MNARTIAAVLIVLASPGAAADPFSDLIKDGKDVCFRRVYDAAHLKKNPRQQTTSMVVWLTGRTGRVGNFGLAVTRRGDPQAMFLTGDCSWEVYRDGRSWMTTYRKKAGAGCITLAVPDVFESSSAEEGGGVILDPSPDGRTMMVHLDDIQSLVKRANRGAKISVTFGADDRAFLLRRAAVKDCEFVKEAVTTRAHDSAK